jgi:hypothetical protein
MVPALHEILLTAKAEREKHGGPAFPTRNGNTRGGDPTAAHNSAANQVENGLSE